MSLLGSEHARRISSNNSAGRNVFRDNTARANDGTFTDCHAAKNSRAGADRSTALYENRFTLPFAVALENTFFIGCARKTIVDECDIVARAVLSRKTFLPALLLLEILRACSEPKR